jgi:hypothetical protein
MTTIVIADRYSALGMARPDPSTMCEDQCEGTGWVPIHRDEEDPLFKTLFDDAETASPNKPGDNWHFVKCPACQGTGKRK